MKLQRRPFLKSLFTAIAGFFYPVAKLPAAKKKDPETKLTLTFYQPCRIYVAPRDPIAPLHPNDSILYWMNSLTTEIFKFKDGAWSKLREWPGREREVVMRDIGIPQRSEDFGKPGLDGVQFSDDDGPCAFIEDNKAAIKSWVDELPSLETLSPGEWKGTGLSAASSYTVDYPPGPDVS